MLVAMKEILKDAQQNGYAVGAFNGPNLESIRAIVAAAEAEQMPVILQHALAHDSLVPMADVAPILLHYAAKASVPVAVHLDHGSEFDACIRAIRLGFTSVMYDGSVHPYEQNRQETALITRVAHAAGVTVEAELGVMAASEVGAGEGHAAIAPEERLYTNPAQAQDFVQHTGVDALAISFGTVHGVYLTEPKLNLERVAQIRATAGIPLVMHGGSGVSDEDFRTAIQNGITKINYYTYMSLAGAEAVRGYLAQKKSANETFFHEMALCAQDVMQQNVQQAIRVFAMR